MQALGNLARQTPELMPTVRLHLRELTAIGTPTMKARGRRLLRELGAPTRRSTGRARERRAGQPGRLGH
jgi:hypothetical protein